MILQSFGVFLLILSAASFSDMSDRKKIEKIFEYTRMWVTTEKNNVIKCRFIRKEQIGDVGTSYVYRLPLGLPYKKLAYLNDNIGVFKDGLNKNVELEFEGGKLHVNVYEKDLPKKLLYKEAVNHVVESTRWGDLQGDDLP